MGFSTDHEFESIVTSVRDLIVGQMMTPLLDSIESATEDMKCQLLSILRNCCFDCRLHERLLDERNGLLVRLLKPLSGDTTTELTDKEITSLPTDLQYFVAKRQETPQEARKLLEHQTKYTVFLTIIVFNIKYFELFLCLINLLNE
jgi:hypothetical protein